MNIKKLALNISIPPIISIIVSLLINTNDYKTLIESVISPPEGLFPVVWTIPYILIGINAYVVSKKVPFIYYINLFFNALWSIIFFTLKLRRCAII